MNNYTDSTTFTEFFNSSIPSVELEESSRSSTVKVLSTYFIIISVIFTFVNVFCIRDSLRRRILRRRDDDLVTEKLEVSPGESKYLVTIYTGKNFQDYQGPTTASTSLHMIGTNFPGKVHELEAKSGYAPLCREKFIISEDVCLGRIKAIIVQTNNYGDYPTWNCQSVIIRNLGTDDSWYFPINDAVIEFPPKLFTCSTATELTNFHFLFKRCFRQEWRQGSHIYWGFCNWSPRSVYSIKERILTTVSANLFIFSCSVFMACFFYTPVTENDSVVNIWGLRVFITGNFASFLTTLVFVLLTIFWRQAKTYESRFQEMDYAIETAVYCKIEMEKLRKVLKSTEMNSSSLLSTLYHDNDHDEHKGSSSTDQQQQHSMKSNPSQKNKKKHHKIWKGKSDKVSKDKNHHPEQENFLYQPEILYFTPSAEQLDSTTNRFFIPVKSNYYFDIENQSIMSRQTDDILDTMRIQKEFPPAKEGDLHKPHRVFQSDSPNSEDSDSGQLSISESQDELEAHVKRKKPNEQQDRPQQIPQLGGFWGAILARPLNQYAQNAKAREREREKEYELMVEKKLKQVQKKLGHIKTTDDETEHLEEKIQSLHARELQSPSNSSVSTNSSNESYASLENPQIDDTIQEIKKHKHRINRVNFPGSSHVRPKWKMKMTSKEKADLKEQKHKHLTVVGFQIEKVLMQGKVNREHKIFRDDLFDNDDVGEKKKIASRKLFLGKGNEFNNVGDFNVSHLEIKTEGTEINKPEKIEENYTMLIKDTLEAHPRSWPNLPFLAWAFVGFILIISVVLFWTSLTYGREKFPISHEPSMALIVGICLASYATGILVGAFVLEMLKILIISSIQARMQLNQFRKRLLKIESLHQDYNRRISFAQAAVILSSANGPVSQRDHI